MERNVELTKSTGQWHEERSIISNRYYIKGKKLSIDENIFHEFKGHRDMTIKDLSPNTFSVEGDKMKMSRQPISRTLCSFLNTGIGGIIYIGILDNGKVTGINLTEFQKDHMNLALKSVVSQFSPPVYDYQYRIEFVPVVLKETEVEKALKSTKFRANDVRRLKCHVIETPHFCWCDNDAVFQVNSGILPPEYVVEIHIKPLDDDDPNRKLLLPTKMYLHPIYQNEEGLCFVRFQGSIIKYTLEQIKEMTSQEVSAYYEQRIKNLLDKLDKLCNDIRKVKNSEDDNTLDDQN